jgi:hypothetical protein
MKSEQPKSDNTSKGIAKAIGAVAFFILAVPALCVVGIFGVFAEGGPLAIISLVVLLLLHWIKRNGWPF